MERLEGKAHPGGARIGGQAGQAIEGTFSRGVEIRGIRTAAGRSRLEAAGEGDNGLGAELGRLLEAPAIVVESLGEGFGIGRCQKAARAENRSLYATVGEGALRRLQAGLIEHVPPDRRLEHAVSGEAVDRLPKVAAFQ